MTTSDNKCDNFERIAAEDELDDFELLKTFLTGPEVVFKLAFLGLYSLSFEGRKNGESLDEIFKSQIWTQKIKSEKNARPPVNPAEEVEALALAKGVLANQKTLDEAIADRARGWRPERIGKLEMILLRMGIYSMYCQGISLKSALAVIKNLADDFGIGGAVRFMAGIMEALAGQKSFKLDCK